MAQGRLEDRLERLERELAQFKRLAAGFIAPPVPRNIRRGRWPARLLADLNVGSSALAELYAYNGTSVAATGVEVSVRGWRPEQVKELTYGFVEFHPDSQWYFDTIGSGEVDTVVRFELTATLSLGGSAAAETVIWNGAAYVKSGEAITVRDFTTAPGTWRGISGYRGWAVKKPDRGDYEILFTEMQARWIEFTLLEAMGATVAGQANATITGSDGDFWWGKNPDAGTPDVIVYDARGLWSRAPSGAKGLATWDEIEARYKIVVCHGKAGAIRFTLGSDGLSTGTAAGNASGFTLDDWWGTEHDLFQPAADASLVLKDDAGLFKRALSGAKAVGIYDILDNVYRVVEAQSKAGWVQYTATGNFAGSPSTANASFGTVGGTQQDVQSPGSTGQVVDPSGRLAGVVAGNQGLGIYDATNDRYIAITDVFVAINASNTAGFLADQLQDWNASAQFTSGEDFVVEHEAIGTAPNQNIKSFVDASAIAGFNAAVEQTLKHDNAAALIWASDTDSDKFVAIDADNTPNYLAPLLVGHLSPQYTAGDDFDISWENTGTAPNQQLRAYIDSSDIPGHNAAANQVLKHGTDGDLLWANDTDTDELVAVEAGNTSGYLFDQWQEVNTTAQYAAGNDLLVEIERVGSAPNKNLRAFVDSSAIAGYNAAAQQVLKHDAAAALLWEAETPIDIVGVSPWISVTVDGNEWTIAHAGPKSGETATTIGSNAEGTAAADTASVDLTATTNAMAGWFVSRLHYDETLTPPTPLYVYFRKISWDSLGHGLAISGETRIDIGLRDRLVALDVNNTEGFLADQFEDWNATAQFTSGEDFVVEHEPIGTAPNRNVKSFIDSSAIPGYNAAAEQVLKHDNAAAVIWAADLDTDELVAVESGNTPGYLFDQWQEVNTTAQYLAGKDLLVEIERVGSAPNKNLRAFVDANAIPGYSSGAQFLGKDINDDLVWANPSEIDIVGVSPWISVTVDGNEWTIAHAGPKSGETATTIGSNAEGTAAADTASVDLTATTNAMAGWFVSRLHYDETLTPPTPLYVYFRKIAWDSLGHGFALSGETRIDIGLRDRLVALDAGNNEGFLADQFEDWNASAQFASGKDLVVEHEPIGTAPNRNVKSFVDSNAITGFSAGTVQFLGKDASDNVQWAVPNDTDIFVAVESGNTAGYLFDQWQEVNATAQYEAGKDLVIEIERVGSAPNKNLRGFVDSNSYNGYSPNTPQWLAKDGSDQIEWNTPPDEKVSTLSGETPNYLANLLTDLVTSGVVLGIDFEVIGTTPNKTIRAKIDLSGISGYNGSVKQALIHTNSGALQWQNISPC